MGRAKERWWGYLTQVVRDYPALKRRYAWNPDSVTGQDYREYDAVVRAMQTCRHLPGGRDLLRFIETYLKPETDGLRGAAIKENLSYSTAKRRYATFLRLVAAHLLEPG